jgi:hypothetical protein
VVVLFYHKYLVYTDANGNKHGLRAGPDEDLHITPTDSAYDENFADFDREGTHPAELIAVGDNLLPQWEAMQAEAGRVGAAGYNYELLSQNSNSFIDHLLRAAGLSEPGLDDFGENFAPGSGRELSLSGYIGATASLLLGTALPGAWPYMDPGAGGILGALFDLGHW